MKRLVAILCLVLCLCGHASALPSEEILNVVKKEFSGKDYEYYLCVSTSQELGCWMIFVNPDPTSGWEHEAYNRCLFSTI